MRYLANTRAGRRRQVIVVDADGVSGGGGENWRARMMTGWVVSA
jgi:hypothetical protein